MTDSFSELYERQRAFTESVLRAQGYSLDALTDRQRVDLTKEYLLSLHKEIDEILDNLDWKRHRRSDLPSSREGVAEEIEDVQKFLWGLSTIWSITPEKFVENYDRKSFVVEERWRMEQIPLQLPVLVCDIDGVVFEYTESFRAWLQENKPALVNLSKVENPLEWEVAKNEYRQSGAKQAGGPNKENIEAIKRFKQAGWTVVFMTYRPKDVFKTLEYDTLAWLKRHEIPVDKLVWAAYEKRFFVNSAVSMCTVFIDDDYDTCAMMSSLGRQVYWVSTSEREAPRRATKVASVSEVWDHQYSP